MSAEPIREATDAELDAKMLRDLRGWRERYPSTLKGSVPLTVEELDLLLRIADERDALRRAFCEEPEKPNPYLVTRCYHCFHAPHGVGFLCHSDKLCTCRGGL